MSLYFLLHYVHLYSLSQLWGIHFISQLVKENNAMRINEWRRNKWQGIKAVYSYQNGHLFKVKCIAVLSALDIRGLCFNFFLIQRLLDLIYVYSILFSFHFFYMFLFTHMYCVQTVFINILKPTNHCLDYYSHLD